MISDWMKKLRDEKIKQIDQDNDKKLYLISSYLALPGLVVTKSMMEKNGLKYWA
jgi:hypothetical protein